MAQDAFRIKKGTLHLTPVTVLPADPELGDIVLLQSTSQVMRYDGSAWQEFIDETSVQTLENKEILNASLVQTDSLDADTIFGSISEDSVSTGTLVTLPAITSVVVKLTNVGLLSVSGITAPSPANGQFIVLTNDLAEDIEILNDDAGASVGNRILTGTGKKLKLKPGASIWGYYDTATDSVWRVVGGSGSGGEGSVVKARLHNAISTTLPIGTVLVDGVTVSADDRVLFSNLATDNNRIYEAVGTLTNITSWVALELFNDELDAVDGDLVVIQEGDSFAGRLGTFKASAWTFNDNVRYFNGVDYWEQSSLSTVLLANNQASPANVFSVSAAGSENLVIEYSVLRGVAKDTGTIVISHNGTDVSFATYGATISDTGVILSADLDSGNIRLRYTSTNTGSAPTIKYLVKRWSDSGGGPASLPSYSIGGTTVGGTGAAGQLAIWDTSSDITSSVDLSYDSSNGVLSIGSGASEIERTKLSSATVPDNTSGQLVFQVPHASYQFLVVDYSVVRGADRSVGTLYITTNGTIASIAPVFTDLGTPGVTFTADVSGANVRLLANTTATGSSADLKYAMKRWI